MAPTDPWITLSEASSRHGKAVETIRRWLQHPTIPVRTHLRHGTRYAHADDLARIAARYPAAVPPEARTACARTGHEPDAAQIAALGLGGTARWLTLAAASRSTARAKSTLTLWVLDGEVRSVQCSCGWRRFVWWPDINAADEAHPRRRPPLPGGLASVTSPDH